MNGIEQKMEIEEEPMKYFVCVKVNRLTYRFSNGGDWCIGDSLPFEEMFDSRVEAMEYFEQAKKDLGTYDPVEVVVCVNPLYEADIDSNSIYYPEVSITGPSQNDEYEEIGYYNLLEEEFPEILEAWRGNLDFFDGLNAALDGDLSDREGLKIHTFERGKLYELHEEQGWI